MLSKATTIFVMLTVLTPLFILTVARHNALAALPETSSSKNVLRRRHLAQRTGLTLPLWRRAAPTSPDNKCGGAQGFVCDPDSANGGGCCSAAGYCGSTEDYCKPESGCQSAFGTCSSGSEDTSPADTAEPEPKTDTAGASPEKSPPASPKSTEEDSGCSKAPGTSVTFANHVSYNFSSLDAIPQGLQVSDYPGGGDSDAPATHTFSKDNVAVKDGYLELRVPGGQSSTIKSAEVSTAVEDMLHASVRMTAILSAVEGTCQSSFFYKSDTQETDIEFLSSKSSTSNPSGKPSLHFTNQQTGGFQPGGSPTTSNIPIPAGAFDTPIEYRIDWLADRTVFYVDGEKTAEFEKNVPTDAGPWVWNNWSNGGKEWTAGPPGQDSVMKIAGIEMWYDRAGDGDKCGGS